MPALSSMPSALMATSSTGLAVPPASRAAVGIVERADALHFAAPRIEIGRERGGARVGRDPQLVALRAAQLRRAGLVLEGRAARAGCSSISSGRSRGVPGVAGVGQVAHLRAPGGRGQHALVRGCRLRAVRAEGVAVGRAVLARDRDATRRDCAAPRFRGVAGAELRALGEIGGGVVASLSGSSSETQEHLQSPARRRPRRRPR